MKARNNNNSPKVEPFVSASDGEVWIVRPVGGRLAEEACAYTYIIHTHYDCRVRR